jgi:hypothetical protein
MYFIYMYENRTMKPTEIFLRRGGGGRMMESGNLTKAHYKHI